MRINTKQELYLRLKSTTDSLCALPILVSSFVHFSVPFTPTKLSLFSLDSHSSKRNLRFLMGPPGLHSSLLLIFFLVFLRALSGDGMSQLVPATEGECERWSNRTVIRKEQEKKNQGKNTGRWRRKRQEGPVRFLIIGGPCWPLTLIMTSEVSTRVRGCVKVPVRQFTPVLGDDDLMQPP